MGSRLSRLLPSPGGTASTVLGFVILVCVWWGVSAAFHLRPVILPSPVSVWRALVEMAGDGSLTDDILTSLGELAGGFALGSVLGLGSGVALARWVRVGAFLDPIIETFRFIVPFSLVPLVVVWFGVSPAGKVFVVAYAAYFVVAINTAAAIQGIDPLVLKAARMLNLGPVRTLVQVVLPAALPRILTGLQVGLAYAWVSVVAAEYVGAQAGLGYLITNAQSGLETDKVLAGMVVIGVLGFGFSQVMILIRRLVVPYAVKDTW
jgi:ABC-type nitrate/sulfonate/bicarbonate transport system permease component